MPFLDMLFLRALGFVYHSVLRVITVDIAQNVYMTWPVGFRWLRHSNHRMSLLLLVHTTQKNSVSVYVWKKRALLGIS